MDAHRNSIRIEERGAALVVALIMMVVLTLIGLASIFSSTFEIKISGNKRGSTDAFYASDCGAQGVVSSVGNFNLPLFDEATNRYNPPNNTPCNAQLGVTHQATKEGAPRGYGVSAMNFEFQHFLVSSTGRDATLPIPATTVIEEKVVRLIPTLQGGY